MAIGVDPNRKRVSTEELVKKTEEAQQQIEEQQRQERAEYFKGINLEDAYLGHDFKLTDYITIHLPTVQDIINYGPSKFWTFLTTFCANPTSLRLMLWDMGIHWYRMSEFELFQLLLPAFDINSTSLFFGDLDFRKFKAITVTEENPKEGEEPKEEVVLFYSENPDIYIDETIYTKMINYLRAIFDYHPKRELPRTKTMIKWMLESDKEEIKKAEREAKTNPTTGSYLLPLLSFFFKAYSSYRPEDMERINYFFFMDGIRRAQEYNNTEALMHGMYSGMLDLNNKKNRKLKKDLNYLKPLY